jgi:single-strand DNA-binding protein
MNHLNSILIEGDIIREPLLGMAPDGKPVCTFSIESERLCEGDWGEEKEVCFFDVEARSKLAERCRDLGRKERRVKVIGRLKQDVHSRVFIAAEHVEFAPEKAERADGCEGRAARGEKR